MACTVPTIRPVSVLENPRFLVLELLVKQKRMDKTALVRCIMRTDGLAEEDSLAKNVQRAPLLPLDQFRAFQAMRETGHTEEEIAAAFFVSASVAKQRPKRAAVAPSLLDAYAEEDMTLDQFMAFTITRGRSRSGARCCGTTRGKAEDAAPKKRDPKSPK